MIKRCEVLVKGEKPVTYTLNRDLIYIGSGGACHVRIIHPSISRKHLKYTVEDGKCFVTDEGSTNGTAFGNQRLAKGQKVEVQEQNSLFLGNQVLLTFLSEAEAQSEDSTRPIQINIPEETNSEPESDLERTRVISLKQLNKSDPDKLIKERSKIIKEKTKRKQKKTDSSSSSAIQIMALISLGVFGWLAYDKIKEPDSTVAPSSMLKKTEDPQKVNSSKLVPDFELVKKSDFRDYKEYPKCENPKEKYLCDIAPNNSGAVQISNMINVLVNGKEYITAAETDLKGYPSESAPSDIKKVAALKFIQELPESFDESLLNNVNVTFAFYKNENDIDFLLSIKGAHLEELRNKIRKGQFTNLKKVGAVIFKYADDYVTIY